MDTTEQLIENLGAVCRKKVTAVTVLVMLILAAFYLVFFEESPYALLFQIPVNIVCIVATVFWLMDISEKEKLKQQK